MTLKDRLQRSKPHTSGVLETITIIGGTAEVGAASETVTISAAQTQTFRGDVPHVYRGAGASRPAY